MYSSAELQERVRSVKERVKVVEGDLEEGREERNAKYRELRTREEKIRGERGRDGEGRVGRMAGLDLDMVEGMRRV